MIKTDRTLEGDWHPGTVPNNVTLDPTAYLETTYSFLRFRSTLPNAVALGRGASVYKGTMFDVGPNGAVNVGEYALVHSARIVCDARVHVDDYVLISWGVVLMDTYRVSTNAERRAIQLSRMVGPMPRCLESDAVAKPVHIGRGAWIGFESCILPGVKVGEGAIVGARSVVFNDVEPFTVTAGNPARLVRRLSDGETASGQ